jgi:riboflavin kinase/FMN adenylyltransferase
VGENFRFGRGRSGAIGTLLHSAQEHGVHVVSIERVRYDGEAVSSTRIRGLLLEGRMAEANELLGYRYYCVANAEPGRRIGRSIGFPTLNLRWEPPCRPRMGVYAVRVCRDGDSDFLPAVANYGLRPTVQAESSIPLLETHIIGDCPFGDGDRLRVEWLHFLRSERRFAGLDELKTQNAQDRTKAAAILGLV